jgi:hypothetical protein
MGRLYQRLVRSYVDKPDLALEADLRVDTQVHSAPTTDCPVNESITSQALAQFAGGPASPIRQLCQASIDLMEFDVGKTFDTQVPGESPAHQVRDRIGSIPAGKGKNANTVSASLAPGNKSPGWLRRHFGHTSRKKKKRN